MAVFYQGPRPILVGQNAKDNVNPYTGKVENYSNWSIFNPVHLLDGMPNSASTPGAGQYPHGLKLSRVFRGLEDREQPLDSPGSGPRLDGFRYNPLLSRAAGNNVVFKAGYGHGVDTAVKGQERYGHVDWIYDGVTKKSLSSTFGHSLRKIGATGAPNSFGTFNPLDPDATRQNPIDDGSYGQTLPVDSKSPYGHNRINEWRGVRRAL